MSYTTTYRHFRTRMREIMQTLQERIGGELWEDNADEYGWHVAIGSPGSKDGYDVRLILEDAEEFEGEDGKGQGAFSLHAVKFGGEIMGQLTPYNYTQDVWVQLTPKGWPELEERLGFIEMALADWEPNA